jgi:uncharacterized protein
MTLSLMSRRRYLALSALGCGCVIHSPRAARAVSGSSADYTSPGEPIAKGKAPGMRTRLISGRPGGARSDVLIFGKGDEVMSGLTDWAQQERIVAAHLTAIGAFSSALFGWFDQNHRAYRHIPVEQQIECISLVGDVGLVDGKAAPHVHGSVALRDGTVRGGHLLEATVWPTLEVFVSSTEGMLDKERDSETDLWLFDLQR